MLRTYGMLWEWIIVRPQLHGFWNEYTAAISDSDAYINCFVVSLLSCFQAMIIDVLVG